MGSVWGIHGRRPWFEMVRDDLIALERPGVGDLHAIGDDRDRVEARLGDSYSKEKDGTIRVWATVLLRFAFEPQVGDLVVHPDPQTRTVNVGRITGDYRFLARPRELHVRPAEWLATGFPRDELSEDAQQDISQRTAFFELKRSGDEFRAHVRRN